MTQEKALRGKYKPAYCTQILDYFSAPPQNTAFKRTYYADGTLKSEEPIVQPQPLPTLQGFAAAIGVHANTLRAWAQRHADFGDAYACAKQLQENIWLQNSMSGLYNATFATFFGRSCLGYNDKPQESLPETPFQVKIQILGEDTCGESER
ncbi:MAG: terminase small subunit [Pygmaiobacter sp.]|nr:terminase small subunit [Pygmaiobacter sp.]